MSEEDSFVQSFIGNASIAIGSASLYPAFIFVLVVFTKVILERKRLFNGRSKDSTKRGIEAIPGPKSLPLIGNALNLYPMTETINIAMKWCKIYGPCFKAFGPLNRPVVFLNSAELVEALLRSTEFGHLSKMPMVYDLMKPFLGNGVTVSKGEFWQMQRKILLKSMSFQSLHSYVPLLNTHCERLIDALDRLFSDGQVHPINDLLSNTFLDIICEIITGFDIHNSSEGVEYHHNFQLWKKCVAYRLLHPWFIPNVMWRLHPLSRENDEALKNLFDFAKRRITMHKTSTASRLRNGTGNSLNNSTSTPFRSVLDELLDAEVLDDQVISEVNAMIFGGHETTAGTIHFLCMCLALNPDVQKRCQREVDTVFDDSLQFQDGIMVLDNLRNLKYVERTVLETLRLYPPVSVFFRQLQAPLEIELNGEAIEIPSGTGVGVCPFILHRKEEYFPEPEQFDPDRFLPEEIAKRPAYSCVPFSMGRRNCLGLKLAMIELKMVAAYLIRNFDIQTTDRLDDVKLLPSVTLTPERDYNFIFKRREMSYLKETS